MTTYRVALEDGQEFVMDVDLLDGAAAVRCSTNPGLIAWRGTPFTTVDVKHDARVAADMLAGHLRPGDPAAKVRTVEPMDRSRAAKRVEAARG